MFLENVLVHFSCKIYNDSDTIGYCTEATLTQDKFVWNTCDIVNKRQLD